MPETMTLFKTWTNTFVFNTLVTPRNRVHIVMIAKIQTCLHVLFTQETIAIFLYKNSLVGYWQFRREQVQNDNKRHKIFHSARHTY